ncbi:M14 family zinc carboxypeptidase [Christiangramia aquimixticola]|uniref:M14 family zinc carboxypeptidase n=1 Tax=Christiangramia aquimixticola TaxID=1697558 RepID=UPI003AA95700
MNIDVLEKWFESRPYSGIKYEGISGRYLANDHLQKALEDFGSAYNSEIVGSSVHDIPIYRLKIGEGKIKILAWSQMHGNESTTTKAVLDLLNAFNITREDSLVNEILNSCTIYIIPVLNPDGAKAYTRVNANGIDLNRDMQDLSQPESRLLMEQYNLIQPDYCLNLHDQRTIFSTGNDRRSAVLSFLTPSRDKERSIDESRKKSMALVAGMAKTLVAELPGCIGKYDDGFNINCAGDTFQSLGTPTILFEAGHYPEDYEREITRKYVFKSLMACLYQIATGRTGDFSEYFEIPENRKLFNDVVVRDVVIDGEKCDFSIQFKETLKKDQIDMVPVIEKIAPKIENYGHYEIDGKGGILNLPDSSPIIENVIVNKILINNEELEFKRQ